ncbi:valyl-tRNA synthetase [Catovirus CTV1]|uniref:valine--tRNA ligase n=1 Tax=Catovirus CTV1 TaxID=1977631 RepID=A0A1V0S951_9VIRU|nr:valyl-tRNA synthetase [Catovirus CTV1]
MESRIDHKFLDNKWQNKFSSMYSSQQNSQKKFSIVMPPPNVTGKLHLGHALNNVYIDCLCRYKRMTGHNVCYLPGLDHAGIATQTKVEKYCEQQGLDFKNLSRQEKYDEIYKWKNQYGNIIINQLKKLGLSCDWSREQFTLSDKFSNHVQNIFIKLYNEGLIYKDDYICNWCPTLKTVISDEEVVTQEIQSKLYYVKYRIENSEEYLVIATTRPETIFADQAIAFHPTDDRYKHYKNKNVVVPLIDKIIPIIQDEYVDSKFGTGLLKITPGHDKNDYEIGKRHNLTTINIFDDDCRIKGTNTKYDGMDRETAKRFVVRDLNTNNAIEKIENYQGVSKKCSRTGSVIESILSKQWFVKMAPLVKDIIQLVESREIEIYPEYNINKLKNWILNIKDWCISRNLIWGHRIPIWYNETTGQTVCSSVDPSDETNRFVQDPNVLDTWFSSWLWPFASFDDNDRDYYFPTDSLITGEDILFFWVVRMIVASKFTNNKIPFKKIFLHGLIRDESGIKMTKSLNNVVDPLDVLDKHGTDPLRFTLLKITPYGNDLQFSDFMVKSGSTFCTKFWNVMRYIYNSIDCQYSDQIIVQSDDDKNIINLFNNLLTRIDGCYEKFDFAGLTNSIYKFVWDDLANNYVEYYKKNIDDNRKKLLLFISLETCKILHPPIPHITEEVWELFSNKFNINSGFISFQKLEKIEF